MKEETCADKEIQENEFQGKCQSAQMLMSWKSQVLLL